LYAAGGRYYDLYTKQHSVEANLFLAPGEGGFELEESESTANGNSRGDSAIPDAIRLIRERNNA
jgi:hypothetical protein